MNDDRPDRDLRPSPEALLEQAGQEGRGRLKVFLGAAPGVGKTYEMLSQGASAPARRRRCRHRRGRDAWPRRNRSPHQRLRDHPEEAAVLQRPCAGGNGSRRHPAAPAEAGAGRRARAYQCARQPPSQALSWTCEEILDAGIDVYTTLNVQHLESLNDVVAQITRIRVRETVPDSIFDRADDVELVDLTPEDLIQRLNEGKVYVPEQARARRRALFHAGQSDGVARTRAAPHRPARRRADGQLHARACHPGALGSKRACAGVRQFDGRVRAPWCATARRLADRLRASWTAIYVETSEAQRLNEAERDRIAEALRVAERLGGDAVTVPASSVADGVIEYAQANNFTHIVVASTRRSRLARNLSGRPPPTKSSAAPAIQRSCRAGREAAGQEQGRERTIRSRLPGMPKPFVGALGIVAVALMVGPGAAAIAGGFQHCLWCSSPACSSARSLMGDGRHCSPVSRAHLPTISSSCRRCTISRSAIPRMSSRCFSLRSSP